MAHRERAARPSGGAGAQDRVRGRGGVDCGRWRWRDRDPRQGRAKGSRPRGLSHRRGWRPQRDASFDAGAPRRRNLRRALHCRGRDAQAAHAAWTRAHRRRTGRVCAARAATRRAMAHFRRSRRSGPARRGADCDRFGRAAQRANWSRRRPLRSAVDFLLPHAQAGGGGAERRAAISSSATRGIFRARWAGRGSIRR